DQRKAADLNRDTQIAQLHRQRLEELVDMETEASLATLAPWQRSYAQIEADAEKRVREIEAVVAKDKSFEAQGAQEIALVWQKAFAQMRDQLANDLESLFDDITSGNIGQRFKKMFEDLVFRMVATWILGM